MTNCVTSQTRLTYVDTVKGMLDLFGLEVFRLSLFVSSLRGAPLTFKFNLGHEHEDQLLYAPGVKTFTKFRRVPIRGWF